MSAEKAAVTVLVAEQIQIDRLLSRRDTKIADKILLQLGQIVEQALHAVQWKIGPADEGPCGPPVDPRLSRRASCGACGDNDRQQDERTLQAVATDRTHQPALHHRNQLAKPPTIGLRRRRATVRLATTRAGLPQHSSTAAWSPAISATRSKALFINGRRNFDP